MTNAQIEYIASLRCLLDLVDTVVSKVSQSTPYSRSAQNVADLVDATRYAYDCYFGDVIGTEYFDSLKDISSALAERIKGGRKDV